MAPLGAGTAALGERIRELYYNCRTLPVKLPICSSQMEFDAGEQAQLEQRLDVLYRLRQKYGATRPGCLPLLEEAKQELAGIEHAGEELENCTTGRLPCTKSQGAGRRVDCAAPFCLCQV